MMYKSNQTKGAPKAKPPGADDSMQFALHAWSTSLAA
jgi:hypothetical protein